MRRSRDEQGTLCRWHERGHGARGHQAGERLCQAGGACVEQAGQLVCGASQSVQIHLGRAVADEQSLAGIKGRRKLAGVRDVEDAAADRKREQALKANLRVLAGGVFNLQSSVAYGAASGGKSRSEEDGARSKRAVRGEQFSGEADRAQRSQPS